ncbi:MAG: dihydroorotate dehydrogenase [Candidatus Dormibacteraeota bacterium]|nr:dihydroorotate dehydrogenase [Candidatus Dormibacteraeota bacterium]
MGAEVVIGRGLTLASPVGAASGTFGYGFEAARMGNLAGLGAIFTKGTTPDPRPGNAPPRIAEVRGGMLNSIGLQNPGVEVVAAEYAPRWRGWAPKVIVNVAGSTIEDYVHVCRRLDQVDEVAGVELNISCPNIAHGLDLGVDPRAAAACTRAVRAVTEKAVIVKLTPNVTDIAEIGRAVQDGGADAVSAVNTYLGLKWSRARGKPVLPGSGMAGLSGPAIKPLAMAAVARLVAALTIPVIGIGGIASADDARDFLELGARAIQIGTANFYLPGLAASCAAELRQDGGAA